VVVLRRYEAFPDPATKYAQLESPPLAEVTVAGPTNVKRGQDATFEIRITFEGRPYEVADIEFVKYLLFDAIGNLIIVGDASADADGRWAIRVAGAQTAALPVGANRLEVVVASKLVGKPSFAKIEFVTR